MTKQTKTLPRSAPEVRERARAHHGSGLANATVAGGAMVAPPCNRICCRSSRVEHAVVKMAAGPVFLNFSIYPRKSPIDTERSKCERRWVLDFQSDLLTSVDRDAVPECFRVPLCLILGVVPIEAGSVDC